MTVLPFLLLLLDSLTLAYPLQKRAEDDISDDSDSAKWLPVALDAGSDFYAIPLQIGNSSIHLKLDTTSNAIWVNSADNEFCEAAYPFYSLGNNTEWNDFNKDLKAEYLANLASFQSEHRTELPTKTIDYQSAVTAFQARQSTFSAYLNEQKSELTKDAIEFASSRSEEWDSITAEFAKDGEAAASRASKFGNDVKTKAESFGAQVTSWGEDLATKVTEVAISDIANPATRAGQSFATAVTSEFGDITRGVASRFDQFTSGLANFFKRALPDVATSTVTPSISYASATATYTFAPSATVLASVLPSEVAENLEDETYSELYDCSIYGTYNATTFVSNETIYVSDEADVVGVVGQDTFVLSGNSIDNVTFALAEYSESNIGSFGLGQKTENSTFVPFPEFLASEGLIEKALYSLEFSEDYPNVLFGAVNFNALAQNLTLVPLLNFTESISITLSSLGLSYFDNETVYEYIVAKGAAIATIDSTSKHINLPFDVLEAVVTNLNESFPVEYDDVFGRYIISVPDSSDNDSDVSFYDWNLALNFQGLPLDIPLSSLTVPVLDNETAYFNYTTFFHDGKNESYYYLLNDTDIDTASQNSTEYILTILPSENDEEITLGLPFLREVYVVVDLEDSIVGLAPLNTTSYDEEEEEDLDDDDETELLIVTISDEIPFATNATDFENYFGASNYTSLEV